MIYNVATSIDVSWTGIDPRSDADAPAYYVDAELSFVFGARDRPSPSFPQGYSFTGSIEDPDGGTETITSSLTTIQKRLDHVSKGTYTLTGTLTNQFCKEGSPYRTVSININGTFTHDSAPFSVAGDDISAPLSGGEAVVSFDGSDSWDDGSIVRYEWDFGDNSTLVTTTQPTIQHTYTTPGVYFVTLNVVDDAEKSSINGKAATLQVTITED
jgi:hypothetical protein